MKTFSFKDILKIRTLLVGIIFLLLPFELYPHVNIQNVTIRMSQVAGFILIITCLPTIFENWRDWLKKPWLLLGVFIVASGVSSLFAISKYRGLQVTAFYAFDFLLAYAFMLSFDLKYSKVYKNIIIISGLVVAAFCLYQFFGDSFGILNKYTLLLSRYTKEIFGFPRIQGFSLEPLYLASYLFIPLSLTLSLYIFTKKKYMLFISGLFSLLILLTVARGAYFALLGIVVFAIFILAKKHQYIEIIYVLATGLISILAMLGLVSLSGSIGSHNLKTTIVNQNSEPNLPDQTVNSSGNANRLIHHIDSFGSDQSFADRVRTARVATTLGINHPILGVGPGNFGRYVVEKYPNNYSDTNQIVNNEPAEIFAETGLIGLILFIIFIIWLASQIIKYDLNKNKKENNMWFFATSFMLLAFAIQWQTFSTLYITHIWVMIGIFIYLVSNSKFKKRIFDGKS